MTVEDFFSYFGGLLLILFIAVLIIIVVYEYDVLRRERLR